MLQLLLERSKNQVSSAIFALLLHPAHLNLKGFRQSFLSNSSETEIEKLRRLLEEERTVHQQTQQELQEKDAALEKFQRRETMMVNHVNRKSLLNLPKTLVL